MAREIIFPTAKAEGGAPVPVVVVVSSPWKHLQVATIQDWAATSHVGQFVDLDRQQVNKLIKALRAARDRAHGRDE